MGLDRYDLEKRKVPKRVKSGKYSFRTTRVPRNSNVKGLTLKTKQKKFEKLWEKKIRRSREHASGSCNRVSSHSTTSPPPYYFHILPFGPNLRYWTTRNKFPLSSQSQPSQTRQSQLGFSQLGLSPATQTPPMYLPRGRALTHSFLAPRTITTAAPPFTVRHATHQNLIEYHE